MSASRDEWLDGMEELLMEDDYPETFLHFVSWDTPDYMFEDWRNMYEAENQEYFADIACYEEEV